jgi:hypothetical protein
MPNLRPLDRMAHVGQVEPALSTCTPGVLQASKPGLEIGRQCMRAWSGIFGTEIKVVTMPFGIKINNIVPLRILGRGLNVFWFQDNIYQFPCFRLHFHLDRIRHLRFWWAVNPYLLSHRILKANLRPFDSHSISCPQTIPNHYFS